MKHYWWRLSPLLFWLSGVLLLPVLVWQGRRARRLTPRLPEATGPASGRWGAGEPANCLLVIGESTAAGVGVADHSEGLASQLARLLYERTGQTHGWETLGRNGARLADVIEMVKEAPSSPADWVLLSMGVNDTTGFTRLAIYRSRLLQLAELTSAHYAAPLVLLSVPPMHRFAALPQPLRLMIGWRARQLDQVKRDMAARHPEQFRYLAYPPMTSRDLLASDGYHPSGMGYRAMAQAIAACL